MWPMAYKVRVLQGQPHLRTKREVPKFLGLEGSYRTFIPHYATLATPLTDLTRGKGNKNIDWTPACQLAFTKIKAMLCVELVLQAPDFTQPNASGVSLGAVLAQGQGTDEHPWSCM